MHGSPLPVEAPGESHLPGPGVDPEASILAGLGVDGVGDGAEVSLVPVRGLDGGDDGARLGVLPHHHPQAAGVQHRAVVILIQNLQQSIISTIKGVKER